MPSTTRHRIGTTLAAALVFGALGTVLGGAAQAQQQRGPQQKVEPPVRPIEAVEVQFVIEAGASGAGCRYGDEVRLPAQDQVKLIVVNRSAAEGAFRAKDFLAGSSVASTVGARYDTASGAIIVPASATGQAVLTTAPAGTYDFACTAASETAMPSERGRLTVTPR